MNSREEYLRWRDDPFFDEETRRKVSMLGEREIGDAFSSELCFGTGGLRGKLGVGTNRMNVYTVGRASQGLADYLNAQGERGGVVIAYDCRNFSSRFALDSALIFAANGIKAYLFESLRPTPELSFAVREKHASAGVVITASHNPPEYNGYKVYLSDGGQIVPPYDSRIIACVNSGKDFSAVRRISREEAQNRGLFEIIGEETDERYLSAIESLFPESAAKSESLKIVYTPLHGTGTVPVLRILSDLGFHVFPVKEQTVPDGNFPTVVLPNPEDPRAYEYALKTAKEVGADLILATDPDADRLGVLVRDRNSGQYLPLSGNMSGILIADYILSRRAEAGQLPERRRDGALVTTIVSSKMARPIADAYGLTLIETLTGFKYIGEQIEKFERARAENGGKTDAEKGAFEFEFGFEESYGSLFGTYTRDKDAVAAAAAVCEAAEYYSARGETLWDRMLALYEKYGYYEENLKSYHLGGEGTERVETVMGKLRSETPKSLGGMRVAAVSDYLEGTRTDCATGAREILTLPKSNVFYLELEEDGWCCVRPSGTEPKIKFYFGVRGESRTHALIKIEKLTADLLSFVGIEEYL